MLSTSKRLRPRPRTDAHRLRGSSCLALLAFQGPTTVAPHAVGGQENLQETTLRAKTGIYQRRRIDWCGARLLCNASHIAEKQGQLRREGERMPAQHRPTARRISLG